jgi:hypothetical protein
MLSPLAEKRLLQCSMALACIVPLAAGFSGVLRGAAFLGGAQAGDLDSHFRYLSGLLLGIGLCFLSAIPNIERHAQRMRLLTLIVAIGGAGRLLGVLLAGTPGVSMLAAAVMELLVTPLLCLWQHHLAQRFKR